MTHDLTPTLSPLPDGPERRDFTSREIDAQPRIWRDWAQPLAVQAKACHDWIAARGIGEVWLCGAGSSAFVGQIVAAGAGPLVAGGTGARVALRAVATTDLVAAPQDLPVTARAAPGRLLVVQFGRSGDSSESVGVMDLLDAHLPDADRLHITCNEAGALATRPAPGPGQARVLTLPAATHDRGFAMTSSFTTMMLSALAVLAPGFDAQTALPGLADAAQAVLADLWNRPAPRPQRAIFLGSGALTGAARESALKVLELTAGATMTAWDSTLGFRHGPKAAIGADTAVFVMIHPDPHTARYDLDVAHEISRQFPDCAVTCIGAGQDIALDLTGNARADAALFVLPAQVLAVRWSQALGLPVDDPFAGRNLTRVVSGVTLYPWDGAE